MSQPDLVAALMKAQSEFLPILKTVENPAFKNRKYADLSEIIEKTRPALTSNGLCVAQIVTTVDGYPVLLTKLMHTGGGELQSDMPLQMDARQQGMQGLGSALTYARRYAMAALLNVAAEEDDDGNASVQAKPQKKWEPAPVARPSNTAPQAPPSITQWLFQTEHADENFPNATALIKHLANVRWTYDLALHNRNLVLKALDTAAAGLKAKPDNATVKGLHRQAQEVAQKVLDLLGESDTVDDGGMIDQPLQAA